MYRLTLMVSLPPRYPRLPLYIAKKTRLTSNRDSTRIFGEIGNVLTLYFKLPQTVKKKNCQPCHLETTKYSHKFLSNFEIALGNQAFVISFLFI